MPSQMLMVQVELGYHALYFIFYEIPLLWIHRVGSLLNWTVVVTDKLIFYHR